MSPFSFSTLSSSSSKDDPQKTSVPAQNQLIQRANANFHILASPESPALKYLSLTRFAPVKILLLVLLPLTPSRHPQKIMLAHQLSLLVLQKPQILGQRLLRNDELGSDSSLFLPRNNSSKRSIASGIQPSFSLINPELLAE